MQRAPGSQPCVLIADDDPSLCMTLRVLFEGAGYQTHVAACGEEAITVSAREQPDLLVLDLLMPSSDGWYVLENLPADFEPSRVLVLSAMSDNWWMQRAGRLGVGLYMTKPFDPHVLLRNAEALIETRDAVGV